MIVTEGCFWVDVAEGCRVKLLGDVLHGHEVEQRPRQPMFERVQLAGPDGFQIGPAGALCLGLLAFAGYVVCRVVTGVDRLRPVHPGRAGDEDCIRVCGND